MSAITTMHIDKHLSATANTGLGQRSEQRVADGSTSHARLLANIPARAGVVVVGRLLDDPTFVFEHVNGRTMAGFAGDVVMGVLGARRALRGVSGALPSAVAVGDVLHVLNRGGVIGELSEGQAPRIVVLGAVADANDAPLTIARNDLATADTLASLPPIVAVAGSCMNAGKTAAACALVRSFKAAGYTVGAAKLTGVAARKDVLAMQDCGAESTVTFVDAGLVSTCCPGDVVQAARYCFNELAERGADIIVAELGDGLLGDYGVAEILASEDIRAAMTAVVFAAADPVAAWGGVELLRRAGLRTAVVTGPTTDNIAGREAVARTTGVPAHNANSQAALLAHEVLNAINKVQAAIAPIAPAPATKRRPSLRRARLAVMAATVFGDV